MTKYLTFVIVFTFVCSILSTLITNKGVGKTAKSVIGVIVLIAVISPIINFIRGFTENFAEPVINFDYSHSIDSEEILEHKKWLAKTTSEKLKSDIEESLLTNLKIKAIVECPFEIEGENVIFDVIQIYTEKKNFDIVKRHVKLHYSLESECYVIERENEN